MGRELISKLFQYLKTLKFHVLRPNPLSQLRQVAVKLLPRRHTVGYPCLPCIRILHQFREPLLVGYALVVKVLGYSDPGEGLSHLMTLSQCLLETGQTGHTGVVHWNLFTNTQQQQQQHVKVVPHTVNLATASTIVLKCIINN